MLRRCWWFLLVLSLLVLLVPACGGGSEKVSTPTPTVTYTPIPTATLVVTRIPTPAPTSTTTGQVKIGAITSWSGPAAISGLALADPIIKMVEKQVKDMGGLQHNEIGKEGFY